MISPALNESSISASTFGLNEKKAQKRPKTLKKDSKKTQKRLKKDSKKTQKRLKKSENNLQTRMISPALNESSTSASTFLGSTKRRLDKG